MPGCILSELRGSPAVRHAGGDAARSAGLESHLCADRNRLQKATDTHKRQAKELTQHIPVEEQLRFLDHRIEIIRQLLESEPETAMRPLFLQSIEAAKRYYKVNTRAIVLDQELRHLTSEL